MRACVDPVRLFLFRVAGRDRSKERWPTAQTGNEHFGWCSDMRNNLLHSELYPAAFRGEGDTLYFVKSTSKNDLASRPSDILDRQCYPFLRNSCRLPQQEKFLCSVDMNRFQLLRYAEDIDSGSPGNHGPKTNNPTTSTP
jgi:hypothetical protein